MGTLGTTLSNTVTSVLTKTLKTEATITHTTIVFDPLSGNDLSKEVVYGGGVGSGNTPEQLFCSGPLRTKLKYDSAQEQAKAFRVVVQAFSPGPSLHDKIVCGTKTGEIVEVSPIELQGVLVAYAVECV